VADVLKRELGVDAELIKGDPGEFTVWVGDQQVAKKGWLGFPSEQKVVDAVRQAMA
jgi:hypothetical protein